MKPRIPFDLLTWFALIVTAATVAGSMILDAIEQLIFEDYR